MATKKEKTLYIFKPAYQKAKKISIRNKTLGKHIELRKEVVRDMALRGKLDENQVNTMFEASSIPQPKEEEKTEDK